MANIRFFYYNAIGFYNVSGRYEKRDMFFQWIILLKKHVSFLWVNE